MRPGRSIRFAERACTACVACYPGLTGVAGGPPVGVSAIQHGQPVAAAKIPPNTCLLHWQCPPVRPDATLQGWVIESGQ